MARKISLNFTATTGNITTSLNKVITKLKLIDTEMNKMSTKDLKVNVNDKALDGLIVKSGQAKLGLDELAKSNLKVKTTSDGASRGMMNLGASMLAMLVVRRSISTFSDLSKEIYTLGTVSQLTTGDIEALRKELISMSDITSAGALSKSVEELVRTGRGLEESIEIISKVSKLAIASGEELGKTSGVIQKIMVALNLEAGRTDEILNILHSTSLNTATSMDQLAVAFKQAGGKHKTNCPPTGRPVVKEIPLTDGDSLKSFTHQLCVVIQYRANGNAFGMVKDVKIGKSASKTLV